MPIALPNLDNWSYDQLVEQARSLIPAYDRDWTNHNPSDPGIALVELFAWLSEMLIYRINRVPREHIVAFLKLLRDPDLKWEAGEDLDGDVRSTVLAFRSVQRATTPADFELLAKMAAPDAPNDVARARCVADRYLGAGSEAARKADAPGHVSVIVVPRRQTPDDAAPQPSAQLIRQVFQYLDKRRLVTARLHVVGPTYVPVHIGVVIASRRDGHCWQAY